MPLFIQCINAVEKVINASKRSKKEIADVVLVGGSSRIPRI
jgi:molecular chaperone DnaK (HSP70)